MIVLGIDCETTGLDTANDQVIELGAVFWDTEKQVPLDIFNKLVLPRAEKLPLTPEITKLTGITTEQLERYGIGFMEAYQQLNSMMAEYIPEYVLAHNGENFDKPLIMKELMRGGETPQYCVLGRIPWIDTRCDLPFEEEPQSRRLNHLALDQGFINPFQHRAVFDVLTMMKVMSKYDFQEIVKLSQVPWVVTRALVDYDDRQKAKDLRYSWEMLGDIKYPKAWVKKIRANQLEKEIETGAKTGVKIVRVE